MGLFGKTGTFEQAAHDAVFAAMYDGLRGLVFTMAPDRQFHHLMGARCPGYTADLPDMRFLTVFAALDPVADRSVLQFWDRYRYGDGHVDGTIAAEAVLFRGAMNGCVGRRSASGDPTIRHEGLQRLFEAVRSLAADADGKPFAVDVEALVGSAGPGWAAPGGRDTWAGAGPGAAR